MSFSDMARRAYRHGTHDPLADDPIVQSWGKKETAPPGDDLVGLSFGRANGPAALVLVERSLQAKDGPPEYAVTHAHRWAAGTPYEEVALAVNAIVAPLPRGRLVVDAALGRSVVDVFRPHRGRLQFTPVLMTDEPGAVVQWDDLGWARVAANEVASVALTLLSRRRLKVGPVADRDVLLRGLDLFSGKAGTLTRLTAAVWGGDRDDPLVLATALACWAGENACRRLIV